MYTKSDNYRILTAFLESGLERKKIVNYRQKTAVGCITSLRNSAKIYHFGVNVIMHKGEVWLVRRKYTSRKEENES